MVTSRLAGNYVYIIFGESRTLRVMHHDLMYPSIQVGISRLYKERCFCVDKHKERGCGSRGCQIHVQLSYLLKALSLWRRVEHTPRAGRSACECDCICCRNGHEVSKKQIQDCSAFGETVHHSKHCEKDPERHCRPLA